MPESWPCCRCDSTLARAEESRPADGVLWAVRRLLNPNLPGHCPKDARPQVGMVRRWGR